MSKNRSTSSPPCTAFSWGANFVRACSWVFSATRGYMPAARRPLCYLCRHAWRYARERQVPPHVLVHLSYLLAKWVLCLPERSHWVCRHDRKSVNYHIRLQLVEPVCYYPADCPPSLFGLSSYYGCFCTILAVLWIITFTRVSLAVTCPLHNCNAHPHHLS